MDLTMKNHKMKKIFLIFIMIISIIMIIFFSYLFNDSLKKKPLINYPRYTLSTTEWTGDSVLITVNNENNKIASYSFDGGVNYQENNTYEITDNGQINIVVKDINGRNSNMIIVSIKNIDKTPPVITTPNITTIKQGTNFSLKSGVQVYDEESGLNSNYIVVPDKIDTTVTGEYLVKYTVFDKAGNYTEKERRIVVVDNNGTTYYRYRTATFETYNCEPYMCNCVVTNSAKQTLSCPTGYTFNELDKCCQSCYKKCRRENWSEWSNWSTDSVSATATRQVETKVE